MTSLPEPNAPRETLSPGGLVLSALSELVKSTLRAGPTMPLLVALAVGMALLSFRRTVLWGWRWLVLWLAAYLVLGTPLVARWLESALFPAFPPIMTAADARGATAIVVLGSGQMSFRTHEGMFYMLTPRSSLNVVEGARLYKLLGGRAVVILSGGAGGDLERSEAEVMAEEIQARGVPRDRLVLESRSRSTAEQAALVVPLLREHAAFLLVTTPMHMARALALFASAGRAAIPAPTEFGYPESKQSPIEELIPTEGGLKRSEYVLYEIFASLRVWLREGVRVTAPPHPNATSGPRGRIADPAS